MSGVTCPKHQSGGGPCYCQQFIEQRTESMIADIRSELMRARIKFVGNNHQLTAFNEEAGELNKAMLENNYAGVPCRDVYMEAVQAAAMAIRVATEGDSTFTYNPMEVFQK